ncbi:FmhC protein [Clostridium perfringens]|uniref:FmhC protein n=1 Tax=Clostridium perfringens TaxID=1502 RepID=UPI001B82CA9B|nr:FmhC protein [Clostridium perfringens]HBC2035110.1 FmhC protein [Clostridium perfringens]HBC2058250.1 FmhC protein [Clostridium perfringens]HBC2072354.1 FmhC protein [Clostridium perfringens]
MRFNSYRELVEYLSKENYYEDFLIKEIDNFIYINKDTFVEDENTKPNNLFDLTLKGKIFSFGITSMNIRKGEIKYYYWLYETIKEQY